MKCRHCKAPLSEARRSEGGRKRLTCGSCLPSQRRSALHGKSASKAITDQEWLALYDAQGGRCALCLHALWNRHSGQVRDKKKDRVAAVDHCHIIEKQTGIRSSIRGLLCAYPCNRLLRRELTHEWLHRAAIYVLDLPAQAVLQSL